MSSPDPQRSSWLPPIDSKAYYILLGAVAIFILGPLGGVTAAYMNFSLGFFVGGQVLAGILGSAVTYGYGPEGKHGANYMQTMAASVAGMSGMAVLIQAMVWMGLEQPPAWQLALYFLCIGMYGVGLGMLYTPFLVDKMQLTFPSGFAVANILRALTDAKLLRASIGKLGSGTVLGFVGGVFSTKLASLGAIGLSTSTFGAGMVVGARIAVPAMVVGCIGEELIPTLVAHGWLQEGEPFRKIGFVIALGTILGAAIVDISLVAFQMIKQLQAPKTAVAPQDEWKQTNLTRLGLWVVAWGAALFFVATSLLGLPALYVAVAMGLVFIFLIINGISTGISDSNPISSAFVLTVFLLAAMGLTSPQVGLMCAAILLVATSIGVDMQQDRSTGWRLGTNRVIQFRYQVIGVVMGAVMAVAFAKIFAAAYPYLDVNQYTAATLEHQAEAAAEAQAASEEEARAAKSQLALEKIAAAQALAGTPGSEAAIASALQEASEAATAAVPPTPVPVDPEKEAAAKEEHAKIEQEKAKWQSAMTYKFVGALSSLTPPEVDPNDPNAAAILEKYHTKKAKTMTALWLGIAIGFFTELLRKIIKSLDRWKRFAKSGKIGFTCDFMLDTFILPSPYASSFGGFVDFMVSVWFAAGGVLTSFAQTIEEEVKAPYLNSGAKVAEGEEVPEDMSTTALVGGGLIAGDSLAALAIGLLGLVGTLFGVSLI